ncbi:MAG: hypothetical protein ACOZBW_01160 [Thermodesulfobacteriota bacterium]
MAPLVGLAAETGVTIDVVGTGVMEQETAATAKKAAIDNGLALAVDAVLRQEVPADILAANFEDLDAAVSAAARKCILTYQVLADARRDNAYRVLVRASVSAEQVRRKVIEAGVLTDRESVPGVLVLLSESVDGHPAQAAAAARAAADFFSKKGFRPVTGVDITALQQGTDGLAADRALEIGRELGADFVVAGRVTLMSAAGAASPATGRWRASVDARALGVDSGQPVFSVTADVEPADGATGPADREIALAAAGRRAVQGLAPSMAAAWEKKKGQTRTISLTVRGPAYLSRLGAFRSALLSVRTVRRVQVREMKADEALLAVAVSGSVDALAGEAGAIRADGFSVRVTDVSDSGLTVELVPDGR